MVRKKQHKKRLTEKDFARIGRELIKRRRKAGIKGPMFKNIFLKKRRR